MGCHVSLWVFLSLFIINYSACELESDWVKDVPQIFPLLPNAAPSSNDTKCREDSIMLINGIKNDTDWAVTMWDASNKAAHGIRLASGLQPGDFDECLLVKGPFPSKYCLAYYSIDISPEVTNNETFYPHLRDRGVAKNSMYAPRNIIFWGLCIPASCSAESMTAVLMDRIKDLKEDPIYQNGILKYANYTVFLMENSCTVAGEEADLSPSEIAFWCYTVVCIAIVALCSYLHMYHNIYGKKVTFLIKSCSMKENLKPIFTFKKREYTYVFVGFNIFKAFNMIAMYVGHKTMSGAWIMNDHYIGESKLDSTGFTIPIQFDFGPDIFLFITGALTCYFTLLQDKKKFINPIALLLLRLIRLFPLYAYSVWFYTSVIKRMGDGPLWKLYIGNEVGFCEKHWWINLLFLNNYYKADEMCMTTSWYLSVDVHCFIVALFILMIIKQHEKIGVSLLVVLCALVTLPGMYQTYYDKVGVFFMFKYMFFMRPREEAMYIDSYIKTHNRISVYLVGMVYGYILYKTRKRTKPMPLWQGALSATGAILLSYVPAIPLRHHVFEPIDDNNKLTVAIWGNLRRTLNCVSLAVGLHAFRFLDIKIVHLMKIFTESRAVTFFARITYAFYLFHFAIILVSSSWIRYPISVDLPIGILNGLGDCAFGIMLALFLEMTVAIPLQNILQALFFPGVVKKLKNESLELNNGRTDTTVQQ